MTKHLTILIAIFLAALGLRAQTKVYPVQVTISGSGDISAELSELYGVKSTLMFTFQCLDRSETSLPVAVKVRLYPSTGHGKAIENKLQTGKKTFDIGFGQTIIEQKGELEKYFLNEYSTLSQAGYYQNGQLAEGNYILQVTCYDARTITRQISNTAKMYLHIDQFGYPTLLQPRSGTDLEQYTTKPAISFQWTYYGKTDPKIRYRFELWKVTNATTVDTYVKQNKPIFSEEDLFVTQKSYMPELLQLQIGHKYCWRVTAYDPDGKLPFKRGGESDVYQFQYLNPPVPVTGLANKVTGKQIKYTWNADRNHTKYYVEYYDYKRDTTISSSQQDNTVTLTAPEYDYRIKFRVRAESYGDPARVSEYTPWSEAYVQPEKKIDFECGKQFPDREIANQELKTTFFEGEIVESKNGDSRYEIIKATARPDGSLDGKFYAIMDCWSGAKILCDFWDTKINTDNIILTTRYRSEDIPGFVADPEEIKKYAHELVNNAHMAATDNKIRDTILINQKFDYLYAENGRLKAVVVDNNGAPQVTDVTPDKPYSQSLITDGQGDTLVVSKKGQVMGVKEYKFAGDDRHLLNEYHRQLDSLGDWQINFNSAKEKQTYAFDQIGSGNHGIFDTDEYYPKSGNYDFRYKSVECGKNDKVIVDYGSYPDRDSVIFKDKYGVKLKVVDGNILSFTGVSQPDTNYIYAYRGDKKIGKLFLNTYQRKIYNVVLVSVNEAKILHEKNVEKAVKKVEESLNKVYNQCAVSFKISHTTISIDDLTSFSHGGSGILTVYNDDQKKVLSAYEKEKKMTDGVYYLFFIDNVTDKKDGNGTPVSGYMPRGYNAGFIYDGGSPHTIAHELGHGIAGLEHVFENSNNSGKTANLMDYASGEELWHFQWDQIQDPSRVWMKWNKDESEGEWTTDGHYYLFTYLGMLMGMDYNDAERLGRYAEEPDSHVFSKEDGKTVIMGDNKEVEVFNNYFEEGDLLPAHTASLIGSNDRYYDKKGREIRFATTGLSLYNWGQISLTAQDIFNGYVDVKDNILEHSQKIKVNDKLNYRLYFKSKTTYMAENTTWVIDELQQRNHALSSGYHGVELAVTAYAIKNAVQLGMKDDVHRYLLHRFGDVFAHFIFDGDEAKTKEMLRNSTKYTNTSLNDYIGALDYFFQTKVIQVSLNQEISGKIIEEEGIYSDGNMFYSTYPPDDTKRRLIMFSLTTKSSVKRISYDYLSLKQLIPKLVDDWNSHRDIKEKSFDAKIVKNGISALLNPLSTMSIELLEQQAKNNSDLLNYFGEYYSFPEFNDLLLKVIKTKAYAIQNDKVMYGDAVTCVSGWTTGHSNDGTAPDEILRRSELFMLYVKRAAELLNIIRGVDNIQLGVDDAVKTIQSAVEWGLEASNAGKINVNARLDGVFSFLIECEKHKNDNEFYVYIPIKFLPKEIDEGLVWLMYSGRFNDWDLFVWDFTRGANNQQGVLERYLSDKGYSVVEPKIVNKVQDDMHNTTPSYIGLKIRKK